MTAGTETCVKVVVRCRPMSEREVTSQHHRVVDMDLEMGQVQVKNPKVAHGEPPKTFTFDRVFDWNSSQEDIYRTTAKTIVDSTLEGYNGTIFAYGQTGTGKSHTMEGKDSPAELRGVIPRAVEHIFDITQANSELTEFKVTVQYAEIYMERIRDLLDRSGTKNNLEIRVDPARGVYIEGATEVVVKRDGELKKVLSRGSHKRHVSATGMNEESSRSHAICMISVAQKDRMDLTVKTGKLFLVDLAGSEMVSKTGATDQRLEEAKQINKSLSALGNVIKALTDGKSSYIPYRDSKLTRILQDSLGGNCRTAMLACVCPLPSALEDTFMTLQFAAQCQPPGPPEP